MVKKPPTTPPEPALRVLRDEAKKKIESRIADGEALLAASNGQGREAKEKFEVWDRFNSQLLAKLFSDASEQDDYLLADGPQGILTSPEVAAQNFKSTALARLASLRGIIVRLELFEEPTPVPDKIPIQPDSAASKEVFIVHGHDTELKVTAARMIEGLGLKATILDEQTNQGKTIIEKLEVHSANAAFAVVLLTPDDVGYVKAKPDEAMPRARQNVILELGLFVGLLGRARVCALVKGSVERPSDIDGVLYIDVDDRGSWKFSLANEMKAAGLKISLDDVK